MLLFALAVLAGCRDDEEEQKVPPPPSPEQTGRFLDEPAGVPPDPLRPKWAQVWVRASQDPARTMGAVRELTGIERVWPEADSTAVRAFIEKNRLWYAPLAELQAYAHAVARGETPEMPSAVEPVPDAAGLAGAGFEKPDAFRYEELLGLVAGGARGNLVLWYPLLDIRARLVGGGRAGVWRGITRLRETFPGKGPKLGGTPVLLRAAVTALDAKLLDTGKPKGFGRPIGPEIYVEPADAEDRKAALRLLGPSAPPPPPPAALPAAWTDWFRAPDGTPVVWLIPGDTNVLGGALDEAVEGLMPVVKQGGRAWLLIALPLAEERKPERFPP